MDLKMEYFRRVFPYLNFKSSVFIQANDDKRRTVYIHPRGIVFFEPIVVFKWKLWITSIITYFLIAAIAEWPNISSVSLVVSPADKHSSYHRPYLKRNL